MAVTTQKIETTMDEPNAIEAAENWCRTFQLPYTAANDETGNVILMCPKCTEDTLHLEPSGKHACSLCPFAGDTFHAVGEAYMILAGEQDLLRRKNGPGSR